MLHVNGSSSGLTKRPWSMVNKARNAQPHGPNSPRVTELIVRLDPSRSARPARRIRSIQPTQPMQPMQSMQPMQPIQQIQRNTANTAMHLFRLVRPLCVRLSMVLVFSVWCGFLSQVISCASYHLPSDAYNTTYRSIAHRSHFRCTSSSASSSRRPTCILYV